MDDLPRTEWLALLRLVLRLGRTRDPDRVRVSRVVGGVGCAGAAFILLFAAVDATLEVMAPPPVQVAVRVLLVALAVVAAMTILLAILANERARFRRLRRRLGEPESSLGDVERAPGPEVLTARELEVALLIGRGLTSREIAARLVITERTADTHADRIRAKLGLRTRAAIVAWVARHDLGEGGGG